VGFDRHLNLFMEEVEKITGDLSNVKRLETIILRGDSILFIFYLDCRKSSIEDLRSLLIL